MTGIQTYPKPHCPICGGQMVLKRPRARPGLETVLGMQPVQFWLSGNEAGRRRWQAGDGRIR